MTNEHPLDDAKLRALAQQLGREAAERLDVERTAEAVVRRLQDARQTTRRVRLPPRWLSLAAGIVLLLGGGVVWRRLAPVRVAPDAVLAPAGLDLNSLSADQLRDVLQTVDQPLDVEPTGTSETGLDDLTPRELRSLLGTLEG